MFGSCYKHSSALYCVHQGFQIAAPLMFVWVGTHTKRVHLTSTDHSLSLLFKTLLLFWDK